MTDFTTKQARGILKLLEGGPGSGPSKGTGKGLSRAGTSALMRKFSDPEFMKGFLRGAGDSALRGIEDVAQSHARNRAQAVERLAQMKAKKAK